MSITLERSPQVGSPRQRPDVRRAMRAPRMNKGGKTQALRLLTDAEKIAVRREHAQEMTIAGEGEVPRQRGPASATVLAEQEIAMESTRQPKRVRPSDCARSSLRWRVPPWPGTRRRRGACRRHRTAWLTVSASARSVGRTCSLTGRAPW